MSYKHIYKPIVIYLTEIYQFESTAFIHIYSTNTNTVYKCTCMYTDALTSVVRWDGTDRQLEVEKPDKLVREHTSSCQLLIPIVIRCLLGNGTLKRWRLQVELNKHILYPFKIWVNPSRDGANASYLEITYYISLWSHFGPWDNLPLSFLTQRLVRGKCWWLHIPGISMKAILP